jgi:hypothetical protein
VLREVIKHVMKHDKYYYLRYWKYYMSCIHCGQDVETETYAFEFTSEDHESAKVKLGVCDVCCEEFRTETDVESVRPIAHPQ